MNDDTNQTSLRQLVQKRVDIRWEDFTLKHPNLAAAIDRAMLVDSVVQRLADDPAYRAAMDQAASDETAMNAGAQVVSLIETWVMRVLGL